MASPTPNKGYTYPAHGGATNAWDTPLNTNFDQIDLNVAGYYPITITSTVSTVTFNSSYAIASSTAATLTPPSSIAQNMFYGVSGTLTQNTKLVLPQAGGFYQIRNATSGAFDLTVGMATGTAATVAQGGTNMVAMDGTDTYLSNTNSVAAKLYTYQGDPNGAVSGTLGSANGSLTDTIWDSTNRQLYIPSVTGSTNWEPQLSRIFPEGILTGNSNTTSPIRTSNISATTIYYTPFRGNWTIFSTGTLLFPYQFSQMSLALTASQAANQIYDIFLYWNSGTPVIGTGPSWTAGGGSVTAGSCARGTGAGSTALTRLQGVLVNNVQVTLTNGATTYVCPASQGIYLGSIFMDTSAGQVTCQRTWGSSRKWGIWNYYNRTTISLNFGISTASWTNNVTSFRQSNSDATATATAFTGMAEDPVLVTWQQNFEGGGTGGAGVVFVSIGVNSTTSANAYVGKTMSTIQNGGPIFDGMVSGSYTYQPSLGINNFNWIEMMDVNRSATMLGTETNMLATLTWPG